MVFIGLRLGLHGFDPSFFITAGDRFCNVDLVPGNITILENSAGYDGQFYYRLALNPFTSKASDFGIRLDKPAHRQQRILYPFIVWLISCGHAAYVPFLLIVVNLGALCLIGWFGGVYAQTMKRHALWGLVFSLYPGFILSLARDLTEILEIAMLMGGLLFIRKGRQVFAAIFLTLAVFAKETALLVPMVLFISHVSFKEKKVADQWGKMVSFRNAHVVILRLAMSALPSLEGISGFVRRQPNWPSPCWHNQICLLQPGSGLYCSRILFRRIFVCYLFCSVCGILYWLLNRMET